MNLTWRHRFAGACALLFMGMNHSVLAAAPGVAVPAATASSASVSTSAPVTAPVTPTRLEDYFLLAVSPSEGVAVLRGPDRRLVTLRVGGTLPSAKARLVQVLGDRLHFDTVDDKGLRQSAWMIRAAQPDTPPEVQRVSGNPPPASTASPKNQATARSLPAPASTKK